MFAYLSEKRLRPVWVLRWSQDQDVETTSLPDTYTKSHIDHTTREPGAAVNKASVRKTAKYGALSVCLTRLFHIAVETAGTWGQSAIELVQDTDVRRSYSKPK